MLFRSYLIDVTANLDEVGYSPAKESIADEKEVSSQVEKKPKEVTNKDAFEPQIVRGFAPQFWYEKTNNNNWATLLAMCIGISEIPGALGLIEKPGEPGITKIEPYLSHKPKDSICLTADVLQKEVRR